MVPAAAECGAPPPPPRPAAMRRRAARASGRGSDWLKPEPSTVCRGGDASGASRGSTDFASALLLTAGDAASVLVLMAGRCLPLSAIGWGSLAGGPSAAAGAASVWGRRCSWLSALSSVALRRHHEMSIRWYFI